MSKLSKINATPSKELSAESDVRLKILETANDDFKELYNKIRDTLLTEEQNVIRSRYEIGEMVYEMDTDESKYGSKAVARMEAAIGLDRSVIYNSLTFCRRYSREQMEALLELRTKSDQPLLWTHVTHLLRVQEVDLREELTKNILEKDMTPSELLTLIQTMQGKGPGRQSNAGKPMARPKSVKGYVDQQWAMVEQLLRRKEKVWAGTEKNGDKSFFDVLSDTPSDKLDASILTEIEQLQKLFEKASWELDEYATKLLNARKRIEREKRKEEEEEQERNYSKRNKAKKPKPDEPEPEPQPEYPASLPSEPSDKELAEAEEMLADLENEKEEVEEIDDDEKPISAPKQSLKSLVNLVKQSKSARKQPVF